MTPSLFGLHLIEALVQARPRNLDGVDDAFDEGAFSLAIANRALRPAVRRCWLKFGLCGLSPAAVKDPFAARGVTRSIDSAVATGRVSNVRARPRRRCVLSLERACAIGLSFGE